MDSSVIKNLLVPLDGSAMAESVLPTVANLAKKINVSVTLIHVIEQDAPNMIHGQRHLTFPGQAQKYLTYIASLDIFNGIEIHSHVHETGVKDVSQSIYDHSKELHQDLVVLCTHGSSGLHEILFGSIAQQVISLGNMPVLLINPVNIKSDSAPSFENFLIPLDGNPDHEHALNYASILATRCNAKINLLIAVPRFGTMSGLMTVTNRFLPGTTSRMMDMIVPDAKEYLQQVQTRLEQTGLRVSTSTLRSNPAKAILETTKKIKADLIILATHGTKGAEAFWEGSVTPKVSKSSNIPLLLVPVKE